MTNQATTATETTTPAIDADDECSVGHQLELLATAVKHLSNDAHLAGAAAELDWALGALDDAYVAVSGYEDWSQDLTDEDENVRALVADELVAVNRRLRTLLALAAVRGAAQRLGRLACRPEDSAALADTAVEH